MRQDKKIRDYSKEIHNILLEDHKTDIPEDQINHILDVSTRRIIESLDSYRYVRIYPFTFYFRLDDLLHWKKNQLLRQEILSAFKESSEPVT